MSEPAFYYEFIAGCFGGFAQVFIGQPFDIVKVRLQSSAAGTKPSAVQTFFNIIKNEGGPLALWKGSLPPLAAVGAAVSIQFGVNENVKKLYTRWTGESAFSLSQLFGFGVIAGWANAVVSVPSEHIRILMQLQTKENPLYKGSVDCFKQILKTYGVKGLYKGTNVTLVREAVSFGTYFAIYAHMISVFQKMNPDEEIGLGKVALSGAISGMVLWPLCFPCDVIKTKIQADSFTNPQYKNAIDCTIKTFKTQGVNGFVKGFWPCFFRAGPANGGTFVAYSIAYNAITKKDSKSK